MLFIWNTRSEEVQVNADIRKQVISKSKKFVNGILDGLSSELVKKGVIKKSGRGLIDNK